MGSRAAGRAVWHGRPGTHAWPRGLLPGVRGLPPWTLFLASSTTLTARVGGVLCKLSRAWDEIYRELLPTRASAPPVREIRIVSATLGPHLWPGAHDYTPKLGKSFPRVSPGRAESHGACVLLCLLRGNLRGVLHTAPGFLPSRVPLSPRETRGVRRGEYTRLRACARTLPAIQLSRSSPVSRALASPSTCRPIACEEGGACDPGAANQRWALRAGRNLNGAALGVRPWRRRRMVWAWAPGLGSV